MDLSSLVNGVLGELAKLAINKISELNSVRGQVVAWQPELELIHAKLKDVESKDKSNTGEVWMKQVRDVANRIGTVIETYKKIEEDTSQGLRRIKFKVWKKPLQLNDLSDEIKSITESLKMLKEYSPQLAIIVGNVDPIPLPTPANKPSDIEDPEVVGFDSDKDRILKQLLDQSISRCTVLSIVGVGGLGKTTLAKKVYNSSELKDRFPYREWLDISQNFNEKNILRKILYSIEPALENKFPPIADDELATKVKSCLSNKRYLIVLDDVWTNDPWDGLRKALPDEKNGSRVIITTRDVDVARAADRNTNPYQLGFLTDEESVALLFRTALQRPDMQPEDYPPLLKDVAQNLIKKCDGLPLAVVVLGGILLKEEDTHAAWSRVYDTLDWHDEGVEKNCMKILAKSYEALPNDHLKKCFLYFAAFPEDYEISAKLMTRLWVADELIPKPRAGMLEDQAEKYLQELVKRCLVQVTKKFADGYCKYCRMHDVLRDLAIHKAEEENFFTVFSKVGGGGDQQRPYKSNHVALQSYLSPYYRICSTDTRSLLCFNGIMQEYQGFEQLRVLVFERVDLWGLINCYEWLKGLVHLRYLGFRYCNVSSLHSDIDNGGAPSDLLWNISLLKSLVTLDCRGTILRDSYTANKKPRDPIPSLWDIPTLRHVITDLHSRIDGPLSWDDLKKLQTLKWIRLHSIHTLNYNVNFRTLKIAFSYIDGESTGEGWQRLKGLLSRMEHLVSLAIKGPYEVLSIVPFLSVGTRGLPCHQKMQTLYLNGQWAREVCVISVEMFPTNLTKLKLTRSKLEEDPMPTLERLQSLRILHLLDYSYLGTNMICSVRGFPSLRELKLAVLENLSEWEIEEGAMPVLSHLKIHYCKKLHTLPELQNLESLQELIVTSASKQLLERSKIEDRYKIERVLSVHITSEWSWEW